MELHRRSIERMAEKKLRYRLPEAFKKEPIVLPSVERGGTDLAHYGDAYNRSELRNDIQKSLNANSG